MSYSILKPSLLAVSANKRRGGRKSTSGFSGVYFHKASGKWSAMVNLATGERKHVGLGETPSEAAKLRAKFIEKHGVAVRATGSLSTVEGA